MTVDTRKRPWIAAVLAMLYPGLGHAYLRVWHRAILWFGAVIVTAVVFIPEPILQELSHPGDLLAVAGEIPLEAAIALPVVAAFNVLDAYWTAKRANAAVDGTHCPYCGRDVDEDLSFCHWCTADLTHEIS